MLRLRGLTVGAANLLAQLSFAFNILAQKIYNFNK